MSNLHRKTIALATLFLFVSLPVAAADAPDAKEPSVERDTAHGELEILNLTATPSLGSLTFRGTVRNVYDQPIEGIRLIMQVRSDPTADSPELARAQKVLDLKLAPAEHASFEIAANIDPATLANPGLLLRAFAMKRGDEALPRTPIWRD